MWPTVPGRRRATALPRVPPAASSTGSSKRHRAGRLSGGRRLQANRLAATGLGRGSTTSFVFPGHEEYVTTHAYDGFEAVPQPRRQPRVPLGEKSSTRVERRGRWLVSDGSLARPRSPRGRARRCRSTFAWNENRYRNAPYVVTGTQRSSVALRRHGLAETATRFGSFGIEVDTRTANSPRSVRVLARIPDVFGTGRSAEMTYYTTPRGAKVFAAGAFTPAVRRSGRPSRPCSTTSGGSSARPDLDVGRC